MTDYRMAQHRAVSRLLDSLDADVLERCCCWFGGGTAIVMDLDEYRLSRDVDFLCSDNDGYRELRTLVAKGGFAALLKDDHVVQAREPRTDQYGIRGVLACDGVDIKFEIVKEGRVLLDNAPPFAGVPIRLTHADQVTEKLLANADRGHDRSTAYRDAIDLGMIAIRRGPFTAEAVGKAEAAYGSEIGDKLASVVSALRNPEERRLSSVGLGMDYRHVTDAARSLSGELRRIWRDRLLLTPAVPDYPAGSHYASVSMDGRSVRVQRRPEPGQSSARLDNPSGPAVVSAGREVYFLDGMRMADKAAWERKLAEIAPTEGYTPRSANSMP